MTDPLILDELRRINRRLDLLMVDSANRRAMAFLEALEAFFGEGRFTVAGLLTIAADDPHGDLGVALADVVDLNASPRSVATRLGARLTRMPGIEVVAETRGSAVYRLVRT